MTPDVSPLQRMKRGVLHNFGLKVFSLLVSIGLFTVVHGSEAGQRSLYVPVVAVLPPDGAGKVLVSEIPDKVKLTLSGSRSVLNSIDSVDAVQIDLSDAPKYYYFKPESFGFPAGIDIDVTPSSLTLEWEERLERKVPVRVQLSGAPDPALELAAKPVVTPGRVTIKGPRSRVEGMLEVVTEPVSLLDLGVGTQRRRVPLLPLPKHVSVVESSDVTVELSLEPKREQRRLRRLPVAALGVAGTVVVRPQHVDVVVAAPAHTLEELDPEHVVPVVELNGVSLSAGAVSVPVKLRGIDEGVRIIRIEPSEVLVRTR